MYILGQHEKLRQRYKPIEVRVLFVGESPPAAGTFFYLENSNLWRYTKQAFASIYGTACPKDKGFCEFFKSLGCYLDDLCLDPVNHLVIRERRRACVNATGSLTERIATLIPRAIICVKTSILPQVKSAVDKTHSQELPIYALPFPSCGHQKAYIEGLTTVIRALRDNQIIH